MAELKPSLTSSNVLASLLLNGIVSLFGDAVISASRFHGSTSNLVLYFDTKAVEALRRHTPLILAGIVDPPFPSLFPSGHDRLLRLRGLVVVVGVVFTHLFH